MNNNIKNIFIFGAGAVIGAVASYYVTKTKYETILEEEINSVKETYKKKADKLEQKDKTKVKSSFQ